MSEDWSIRGGVCGDWENKETLLRSVTEVEMKLVEVSTSVHDEPRGYLGERLTAFA